MKVLLPVLLAVLLAVAGIRTDEVGEVKTDAQLDADWQQTVSMLRNQLFSSANFNSCSASEPSRDSKSTKWFWPAFIEELLAEGPICNICRTAAGTLLTLRRSGASQETIRTMAVGMCNAFQIAPSYICEGMVDVNLQIVLYVIDQRPRLTANSFCGVLFQAERCQFSDVYGTLEWSVQIDETGARPPVESKRQQSGRSAEDLTIVHITDTHSDPLYVIGSLADCTDPVCCRATNETVTDPQRLAGRWGDYRSCDSPWEATMNVFEEIKARHKKIDYVYYTGDVVDHAIWRTSFAYNADTITRTFDALHTVFGDIPVLPVIGNHEPHPVNQFAPFTQYRPGLETNSLYNLIADSWRPWLPKAALDTVRVSGYYTVLLRPGLRIIGLNNNDGSTFNFWLLYDSRYTRRQLQWLHDTLLAAERAGEKVHLLVHFPNGHRDMLRTYSREYQRIVERFWDTISAQFNGHTHRDQFYVFYDRATAKVALNVAWNGGSATTYSNVNPNYRVYSVEPHSYQVNDHETYIYNLTAANQQPNEAPQWFSEYSFRDAYQVTDLAPATLDTLLTRMSADAALIQQYWQFKVKQGDRSLAFGCGNECLAEELCSLASTMAQPDRRNPRCMALLATFWKTVGTPKRFNGLT